MWVDVHQGLTAVGYLRVGFVSRAANVCLWHKADILFAELYVSF
jgi:hypothetical protein